MELVVGIYGIMVRQSYYGILFYLMITEYKTHYNLLISFIGSLYLNFYRVFDFFLDNSIVSWIKSYNLQPEQLKTYKTDILLWPNFPNPLNTNIF